MKIKDARELYSTQISSFRQQRTMLSKQKQELEKKMNATPEGKELFADEAASLDLSLAALDKKQGEYQDYMSALTEQWAAYVNALTSQQQSDTMAKYTADIGKIMEVARRIMKGGTVPASDEKKLMEYSMELYQAAKNIGALADRDKKEKYDSLWDDEDEENKEYEDPMEAADGKEALSGGPSVVSAADVVSSAVSAE